MRQSDIASWIYVMALFVIVLSYLAVHIPYALRYLRRKNWIVPARFVGYAFKVQEQRFGGYFVVIGEESALEELPKNLQDCSLQVRYDPSDPTTSLLVDYKDARFKGLRASQDPDWLDQAPAFDLQDALRGQDSR